MPKIFLMKTSSLFRIWNPDILMYNSASKEFDSTYKVNIIVYSDGSCKYGPPGIFTSTCQVDLFK